jgi:hypothetical protein
VGLVAAACGEGAAGWWCGGRNGQLAGSFSLRPGLHGTQGGRAAQVQQVQQPRQPHFSSSGDPALRPRYRSSTVPAVPGSTRHTPGPSCASASSGGEKRGGGQGRSGRQRKRGERHRLSLARCRGQPAMRGKERQDKHALGRAGLAETQARRPERCVCWTQAALPQAPAATPPAPQPIRHPPPATPNLPPPTRCAEKDWRLEFQKASTKILLYLMATGHTVASVGSGKEGWNEEW